MLFTLKSEIKITPQMKYVSAPNALHVAANQTDISFCLMLHESMFQFPCSLNIKARFGRIGSACCGGSILLTLKQCRNPLLNPLEIKIRCLLNQNKLKNSWVLCKMAATSEPGGWQTLVVAVAVAVVFVGCYSCSWYFWCCFGFYCVLSSFRVGAPLR